MTSDKVKHSPLPWRVDIYGAHPEDAIGGQIDGPNGQHIADLPQYGADSHVSKREFEANAAYIVKACNLFPELVEALELMVNHPLVAERDPAVRNARGVLSKAREQ